MTADAATPSLPITPPSQLSSPGPLQASPSLSQDGSSSEQACPPVLQGPVMQEEPRKHKAGQSRDVWLGCS